MPNTTLETSDEMDSLTPQQRLNAIAEILAAIALRAVNSSSKEQETSTDLSPVQMPVHSTADEPNTEK